jgi:predicted O-methyltransferase YrrM
VIRRSWTAARHPTKHPAGHYYSPIPDRATMRERASTLWPEQPTPPIGVDLNLAQQLQNLERIATLPDALYDGDADRVGLRYAGSPTMFGRGSARLLSQIIRLTEPKRIVEVGSGFSSAVMLDTNQTFFDNAIRLTCIEPYPERLRSLLQPDDSTAMTLIESPLELVPGAVFDELQAGDILFIDSTHVAKTGSDVNYLLFEILPRLQPGVYVHFHDIYYPFEYPQDWVLQGFAWNEAYCLRAFLTFNPEFSIWFWGSCLLHAATAEYSKYPGYAFNSSSIWLRREPGRG